MFVMKDKLILLMWVSGSGKTTLLTELLQTHSQLILVPSYTTRPMRPNEKNGRKYWHITEKEFQKSIDDWDFLEYAVYSRNHYWTKISDVKKAFEKWLVPITEIEMSWLQKIIADSKWIKYVSIFLNLNEETMIDRIKTRWNITQEEISRRVSTANNERPKANDLCDYVLDTNDTLFNNIKNINKIVKKILNDK